jgi:hypothetical protein
MITNAVLEEFLTNERNDVLAMTGAWGVGKTHAWREAVRANKERIAYKQYCYVSLFGIKSMADLRMAIFAKSESVTTLGRKRDLAMVNENFSTLVLAGSKALTVSFRKLLNTIPHGNSVSVGLETLAPHFVRDTLICIDDFERQTSLTVEDILGFISELKEEKGCKVALIFNADKLALKDDYRAYKEKVVDYEVLYAPTAREAFDLVFEVDFLNRDEVFRRVVDLNITNVRILRKVRRVVDLITAAPPNVHPLVLQQAISTAILLCWVGYAPEDKKPKIEDIDTWNNDLLATQAEAKKNEAAQVWVKRLKAYGFTDVDALDLAIARIVERGYVDGTNYIELATERSADLCKKAVSEPFHAIWERFHESFAGDQDEFIVELYRATLEAMDRIGTTDLDSTVGLLRELQRDDLADDAIQKYVGSHIENPQVFDLEDHPFGSKIHDSQLRAIFKATHDSLVKLPSLVDSLSFMARTSSYNPEHLEALKQATVDDYHALFLAPPSGVKLSQLIKWSMRWAESGPTEISDKARQALQRIQDTSLLNSIRVARRGI